MHNCFPFTPILMKVYRYTPNESRMGPDIGVKRSKVKITKKKFIDFWKWLMSHNCFPFTPIIMKLHTKTPLEWRVCPMGVGVKRSKVKVTMQWWLFFMAYNCFSFTSAIIKLHAQIPCESRICLTDIGVKNVESLNWLPRGVFVPLGQPHSSLGWSEKQNGCPGLSWAEIIRLFLRNHWMEFNESWQEPRSQHPLPSLRFFGRSVNKNGHLGWSFKKVAHCTQVHVMWPFGSLVSIRIALAFVLPLKHRLIGAHRDDHFVGASVYMYLVVALSWLWQSQFSWQSPFKYFHVSSWGGGTSIYHETMEYLPLHVYARSGSW